MDTTKNECPECAEPTNIGAKFCGKCGASISPIHICPKCSTSIKIDAKFCGHCGHQVISIDASTSAMQADASEKNEDYIFPKKKSKTPVIATILSCGWPGAGQIYLGQLQLGLSLLMIALFLYIFALPKYSHDSDFPLLLLFLLWSCSIISAYKDGDVLQQNQPIHKFGFFWTMWTKDEPTI